MRKDQVVGLTLNRIEDAIRRGFRDRMYFIDFNNLTREPKKTLQGIYEFLGKDYFEHDFNHVEQVVFENDEIHGYVDLHKIRNKIEFVKSKAEEILGIDVIQSLGIK